MCFIKSRDDNDLPPYKCCCCCNIFFAVVLIFLLECIWLAGAVMAMEISGMAVSGVLVLLFLLSFCVQGELWVR